MSAKIKGETGKCGKTQRQESNQVDLGTGNPVAGMEGQWQGGEAKQRFSAGVPHAFLERASLASQGLASLPLDCQIKDDNGQHRSHPV